MTILKIYFKTSQRVEYNDVSLSHFSNLKKYPFTLLTTSQTHPEEMKNQGGFCKSSEKGLVDPARLGGHLA